MPMPTWMLFILYSMLFAFSIYYILSLYNKQKILSTFIFFQVAFILYYIFIPLISIIAIEYYPNELSGFLLRISRAENSQLFFAFVYTFIFYFTVISVYHIGIYRKGERNLKSTTIEKKNNNFNLNYSFKSHKKGIFKFAVGAGLICLIIAIIAELIIANSLGGIINAVSMGDKLRAFGGDNSNYIHQSRLPFLVLMVFSLASTYFFVYALRIYRRFLVILLLILSIFASVFYLLINAGRLGVLLYALPFLMDFAFRKFKHPFIFLSVISVAMLGLLGLLDDLFFYLSYGYVKESSSSIFSIINEFAFPYLNLVHVNNINDTFGIRLGLDYFTWIVNIIPTSILSMFGLSKVTSGYEYITEYYFGANATGGIPTDLITLGVRQFSFVGVLLTALIIAIFSKYFDKIIYKVHSNRFYFMTIRISLIMFIIVPYADLDSFVRNRYDMLLILVFAIIVNKIIYKNTNHNFDIGKFQKEKGS